MLKKRTQKKPTVSHTSFQKQKSEFSHTHHSVSSVKSGIKPRTQDLPASAIHTTTLNRHIEKTQPTKNIIPVASSIHHQIRPSKYFLFWQKLQLFIFLFIFSAIMLCCTQNPYIPPSQQTLNQTIETIVDNDASCSVPQSAQIIHLPQVHKFPEPLRDNIPDRVLNFFHDIATRSQFLIAHIISEHPSYIVFNEGSRFVVTEDNKENLMYTAFTKEGYERYLSFEDIAYIFNNQLPSSYNNLSREQKNLLLELGAASVALSLDHIQIIHRTQNPSEAKLLGKILTKMWDHQSELISEFHDLYTRISTAEDNNNKTELTQLRKEAKDLSERRMTLEERSDYLVLDKREEILAREVHYFLDNNPSRQVFIIYGAAHDLSDEFNKDHFYTLPHRCTMPESFLKSSHYARYLASWAGRIYNDNDILFSDHVQSMIVLYQKSYDILTEVVEEHVRKGGNKKDPSQSWNEGLNRYLTYSELESIAEVMYVQKTGWEDILQTSTNNAVSYIITQ
ncbi:MAG: hypothetical protein OXK80_04050 [Bdellovibrionales bacterium]|nr:hypothetical protein [Bdellovibrionales bacterium]